MEPIASVFDGLKNLVQSGEDGVRSWLHQRSDRPSRNPIEILKRLQRESFSDLMKLRDRQDKFERFLYSKSGQGSLFNEDGTHIKGIISAGGAFPWHADQQAHDALGSLGLTPDISARFNFKASLREKDALVAEFVSSCNNISYGNELTGSPLVLSKVIYMANINDLFTMISIPFGATCNDFQFESDSIKGGRLARFCFSRPPLFYQHHACGSGLTVKSSTFAASLAGLVSSSGMSLSSASHNYVLNTFGEISCQPFGETKFTVSGGWQIPSSFYQPITAGKMTNVTSQPHLASEEIKHMHLSTNAEQTTASPVRSFSMMMDIDESTKFGGWIEIKKSNPSFSKWAISLSDVPDYETGWGMVVGGLNEEKSSSVVLGGFLNFFIGKRANLQPGLILTLNERGRSPALMLNSNWCM